MIYILGITHSFQILALKPFSQGGLDNFASRHLALYFESYLSELVDRLKPHVVCEEYSCERLLEKQKIDGQAYLVAQNVCRIKSNVPHMFCDPDRSERNVIFATYGTSDAEEEHNGYPIREEEWLRRILPFLPKSSLIFICGASHVASIQRKLKALGHEVSVICEDLEQNFAGQKRTATSLKARQTNQ